MARRTWRNFREITSLHSKSLLAFLTHTHTRNYYFIGTLPGFVIKLISEGKADFDGCKGPFTLPTDLSSIENIEKIDLSSLGGRLQGRTIPSGTFFCVWRTSPLFLWKIPLFGVTDSALPTLYSTSLPRGLMLLSPFVLVTATLQATSRCLKTVHS